ncbi:MAG: tetratricopeptide repeat protein [Planctomycetes bacterium]|nr:tetratricopeptide repeat protein [Planctomycetota bacterium]
MNALMARGYYDLLDLQYHDWLKQPGLKPEQVVALKHGLIRVYTEWAEAASGRDQKNKLWDRAMEETEKLLSGTLSSRDRARLELDLGIVYLNKGNADIPDATAGSQSARERARLNLKKAASILRSAKDEASRLLEESFRLGGGKGKTRRKLVALTLEGEFRLAWALYGLATTSPAGGEEKMKLLQEAETRFRSIAESCPGTSAARESNLGIALCLRGSRDLMGAEQVLRNLLRDVNNPAFKSRVYYHLALLCQEMGKSKDALDAARTALRVLRAPNPEMENACRLLIAKCLYSSAAKGKGPPAEKEREEAREILRKLDAVGGRWAQAARQVMIAQAKTEGGRYKAFAEAEAKMGSGDYQGAIKDLERFLSASKGKMAPELRAELFFKMGLCHSNLKQYDKAGEAFETASKTGGNADQSAQAAYFAVVCYGNHFSQTQTKEAEDAYVASLKDLLRRFPEHADRNDVRYRLARILEEKKKFAAAAQEYERVDPDSPLRRGAVDRAAGCLERLLRDAWAKGEAPEQEKDLLAKVVALLKEAGRPLGEGERQDKEGREANAIAANACVRLARLYLNDKIKQPGKAVSLLTDFGRKHPNEPGALEDALFMEAWALGSLGKLDAGLAKLQKARAAFPKSTKAGPAAITLALGFEMRARSAKTPKKGGSARETAAELFTLALQSPGTGEQESVQMWLHLAEIYVEAKEWKQAKQAYSTLERLFPKAVNVHEGLARCDTGLGEFKEALVEWRFLERAAKPGSEKWWEAKYMIVFMHYKLRDYKKVQKIISVTKVLRPSLGGPKYREKFLDMEKRTR